MTLRYHVEGDGGEAVYQSIFVSVLFISMHRRITALDVSAVDRKASQIVKLLGIS